jgi:hypothetical protein
MLVCAALSAEFVVASWRNKSAFSATSCRAHIYVVKKPREKNPFFALSTPRNSSGLNSRLPVLDNNSA